MPAALWNVLKAWLALLAASALLALLGYAIGGYRLASVFAFAGLLFGLSTYWVADRAVLGMLGARELPEGESPGTHSTVARLAATAGVAKPRLYVIAQGPPLALAVGRGVFRSSIAATASLLRLPVPAEVEAVLAHEVAHVRRRDIVVQTPVVLVSAALVEASRLGGWLSRALLYVLGPVAAALQHIMLSRKREYGADALATELTGSADDLADALLRLDQALELVEFEASPAAEPLFTVDPFEDAGLATMFSSHPPVAERVRRLRNRSETTEAALGRPRK